MRTAKFFMLESFDLGIILFKLKKDTCFFRSNYFVIGLVLTHLPFYLTNFQQIIFINALNNECIVLRQVF